MQIITNICINWWENQKKFWIYFSKLDITFLESIYIFYFFFCPFWLFFSVGFYQKAFTVLLVFLLGLSKVHEKYGKDTPSLSERFLAMWNDPDYYEIKNFWSENFVKCWKQRKGYYLLNLVWELPLFLIICFYLLIVTRFSLTLVSFYVQVFAGIFIFYDPIAFVVLIVYHIPLLLLSWLASFKSFQSYIDKNYGVGSLKRLGFNSFFASLTKHSKRAYASGALLFGSGVANVLGGPIANEAKLERAKNLQKSVIKANAELREYGKELDIPFEPVTQKVENVVTKQDINDGLDIAKKVRDLFLGD